MPVSKCINCHCHSFSWIWEEAFDKFGFHDGGEQIETYEVADVLTEAGYEVKVDGWGMHNMLIVSIKKDGKELIPHDDPKIAFGYTDARDYLPAEIIALLDDKLPADE